jgi:hypothetical protein
MEMMREVHGNYTKEQLMQSSIMIFVGGCADGMYNGVAGDKNRSSLW